MADYAGMSPGRAAAEKIYDQGEKERLSAFKRRLAEGIERKKCWRLYEDARGQAQLALIRALQENLK